MKPLKPIVTAVALVSLGIGTLPVAAVAEPSKSISVQLTNQPLDQALTALAAQAGVAIAGNAELLRGKRSPALEGAFTIEQAFEQLLEGSGVRAVFVDATTVKLEPAREQAKPTPMVSMSETVVTAFKRDYREDGIETGLGLEADRYSVPLSTASVPMDVLEDQQVNNVDDALRNIAGVTRFKLGNGGEERFSIRGFDAAQSLYKDGARINNLSNATNIATTETANIERYEVLKGPAAILFGQGEPGGVINYVTKKPEFEEYQSAELIGGTDSYKRIELDSTGPVGGPDSDVAYRMVASYEDSEANRDHVMRERLLLAPSLAIQFDDETLLTLQYEKILDDYTQDRGQVLEGDSQSGYRYSSRLNDSQFFGVPGWNDQTNSDYQRLSAVFDHEQSAEAKFQLRFSTTRIEKNLFDANAFPPAILGLPVSDFVIVPDGGSVPTTLAGLPADMGPGDVLIAPRGTDGEGRSRSLSLSQSYRWDVSPDISHEFLVRALGEYQKNENENIRANVRGIIYNVDTKTYTGLPSEGVQIASRTPSNTSSTTEQRVISLQDLISIGDRFNVLFGASYAKFEDKLNDDNTEDFSPRVGAIFKAQENLSFYASWANSFSPTTSTDLTGKVVKPETSQQFEVGLKWGLLDDRLQLDAAAFDVYKDDVIVVDKNSIDPISAPSYLNAGENHSRGAELQIVGEATDSIRLIGSYTYLDNEFTDLNENSEIAEGNSLPGVPEHAFSFWGVYEFVEGPLQGLGLGAGVFSQSDVYVSTQNQAEFDSWTQFDAVAFYKLDNWKVQLNVANLTDEEYNLAQAGMTSDTFGAIRVGTAAPMSAKLSLSVEY